MKWNEFYTTKFNFRTFLKIISGHIYLFYIILKFRAKKILEVGCGTSSMSILLSFFVKDVVALDKDPQLIKQGMNFSKKFRRKNIKFICGDVFDLPLKFKDNYFDVVFSQGLLEHFSDEDIRKLVYKQIKVAKYVIFSVPNEYYPKKDFGNERLMNKDKWESIVAEHYLVLSKYYGRNWRKLFLNKPIHYLCVISSFISLKKNRIE